MHLHGLDFEYSSSIREMVKGAITVKHKTNYVEFMGLDVVHCYIRAAKSTQARTYMVSKSRKTSSGERVLDHFVKPTKSAKLRQQGKNSSATESVTARDVLMMRTMINTYKIDVSGTDSNENNSKGKSVRDVIYVEARVNDTNAIGVTYRGQQWDGPWQQNLHPWNCFLEQKKGCC